MSDPLVNFDRQDAAFRSAMAGASMKVLQDQVNPVEIRVERGIPIPPQAKKRAQAGWKRLVLQMEIGDSFFVPERDFSIHVRLGRDIGFKFTTRRVEGGKRVWRVG